MTPGGPPGRKSLAIPTGWSDLDAWLRLLRAAPCPEAAISLVRTWALVAGGYAADDGRGPVLWLPPLPSCPAIVALRGTAVHLGLALRDLERPVDRRSDGGRWLAGARP